MKIEFIEHTIEIICLTLTPTTTWAARAWNPLSYPLFAELPENTDGNQIINGVNTFLKAIKMKVI